MFKLQDKQGNWRFMGAYEMFEQVVILALSIIIALVIVIALLQLYEKVLPVILEGGASIHSIVRAAVRKDSVVQVRTVLLIAILAMSRKFVILDASTLSAATIAALSVATVALGIVYWLLRDLDQGSR